MDFYHAMYIRHDDSRSYLLRTEIRCDISKMKTNRNEKIAERWYTILQQLKLISSFFVPCLWIHRMDS